MPSWFAEKGVGNFPNDPSLSDSEIALLAAWAEAKAPPGDRDEAPPPRKWAERWTIAAPETVFPMTKAMRIPADGEVDYTYEIVPTHFSERRWVQSSEILRDARKRASRRGVCAATRIELAEARAGGKTVHRCHADKRRGPPGRDVDRYRYTAGIDAGKHTG